MPRPHFSLLTILLVMAIVACAFTIWRLHHEMQPRQAEVHTLRKELGKLEIRDPTKVHAIQMPTDAKFTWKWRIWIPPGRSATICHAYQGILAEGLPQSQGTWVVEPGEHIVTWSYECDLNDGKWYQFVRRTSGSLSGGSISGGPFPPPGWLESGHNFAGAAHDTTVEGAGLDDIDMGDGVKRVLIQRLRFSGDSGRAPHEVDGPLPGFVLWVELQ